MKIFSLVPAVALFSSSFVAEAAQAFPPIVPGKNEYAVLISQKTAARPDWKSIADAFAKKYRGKIITWNGENIADAENLLKKAQPRYVAIIARPEEIDRTFIADFHRVSRKMNDDIFGDFLWGIITGRDAETAKKQLAPDEPLLMTRALGTTNFDQERFRKSFFITDWGVNEFVATENYISGEKTSANAPDGMAETFAEQWGKIQPQYLLSASHATEFNLEMPFGKGLIASAGTDFFIFGNAVMNDFRNMIGNVPAVKKYAKEKNLKKLPKSNNPKIWIAAGNCLFGDVFRTADSMAVTAISIAGVRQLVGYTIPSWFGEGGWGTHNLFFNGGATASVGQAWFFNNQILLKNLPEAAARIEFPVNPKGFSGLDTSTITRVLLNSNIPTTKENIGRVHDRDTVAFYGDPLFFATFDPDAKSIPPWKIVPEKNGNGVRVFPTQGKTRNGKFCWWFPQRIKSGSSIKAELKRADGKTSQLAPTILTENFLILENLKLAPGDSLKISSRR